MNILAIFAHPDDESYGPGGTLAKYATAGNKVFLLTFTRGEAGSLAKSLGINQSQLAELRTRELLCAARALDIRNVTILDFPDNQLENIPSRQGHREIARSIDLYDPDVIITFHWEGISGHPDHKVVSRWCAEVVESRNAQLRLMLYGVCRHQAQAAHFRTLIPMDEHEITHRIDVLDVLSKKIEAIHCHKSQLSMWENLRSVNGGFFEFARYEYFSQVWPPVHPGPPEENF